MASWQQIRWRRARASVWGTLGNRLKWYLIVDSATAAATGRRTGARGPQIARHQPRFIDDNRKRNLGLDALCGITGEKRAAVARIAVAWVLAQGDEILLLVGVRQRDGPGRRSSQTG